VNALAFEESPMEDPNRSTRWLGFAFDATIIISLTTLTVARVMPITVFVGLVGPLIGSRLALRYMRDGGGPPGPGAGGSAVLSLAFALGALFRRPPSLA
jgi:hypothetical protein